MIAFMKEHVHLLGTSLSLHPGQRVEVKRADNLPQGGWFARPANGIWSDGIKHNADDSIHVERKDFSFS